MTDELRGAGERFRIVDLMRARLGSVDAADAYPPIVGLMPIDGPHRIAPDRWRAIWRLADGDELDVEAVAVDDGWQVVAHGRSDDPPAVLDDRA
jgi:hypothetical protein